MASQPKRGLDSAWLFMWLAGLPLACSGGPTVPQQFGITDPCVARARVSTGPIQDPNGPYYHQVVMARTNDGLTLSDTQQLLDHASVPDGVRLPDGRVLIYYVNGADGAVFVARIAADSTTVLGPIAIDGVSGPAGVVDPDALIAPDGRVRLYYLAGFGPPGSGSARAICVAESLDGVNFTKGSGALAMTPTELFTDPSVVRLLDGSWAMAVSLGQSTVLARSSDGKLFERYATVDYGGVPELAITTSGGLRLYVCRDGIESWLSTDGGNSWKRERVVVAPGVNHKLIVCDPSMVTGAGLFLFKTG